MRFIPAVVTALLMTGCMGQLDGTDPGTGDDDDTMQPPPAGTAKSLYTSTVQPIMTRCDGGACHGTAGTPAGAQPRWVNTDASAAYEAITKLPTLVGAFNTQAGILTKIAAGHNGITYTTGDTSAITNWLSKEATERANSNQPPPVDPIEVLKKWSGCMTLANFQTAKMTQVWGALATSSNQRCTNCHQDGLYGMIITNVEQTYFDTISKHKDYLLMYFTVDSMGKVIINTASMAAAGVTLQDHPRFDPVNNAGMPALNTFYQSTLAAQTAGTCGPPTLVD